jgi:autophagy-related protein 18
MLFCTSLICLVGAGEQPTLSPRRLRIYNTKTEKYICELNFLSTVLNVRLNLARLICVLENKIHIFDLKNMKVLHTIDTVFNPTGICALSSHPSNAFMCYPASDEKGEIFVYDALNLQVVSCIRAHNTPIRCCNFNAAGTMLATCSNQGTVIRVFSIPQGKKLYTFRRGTYPAKVNTINFNRKSDLLVVSSSDSTTVHVFSMRESVKRAHTRHKRVDVWS